MSKTVKEIYEEELKALKDREDLIIRKKIEFAEKKIKNIEGLRVENNHGIVRIKGDDIEDIVVTDSLSFSVGPVTTKSINYAIYVAYKNKQR